MIVFEVIVNGTVKEIIQPKTTRLKEITRIVTEQLVQLKRKYGSNLEIERKIYYRG